MINPNTYYTVQAWMVNDLGLKGNELALYAIIYGFSQDGRSEFVGSISYIQEWLGCGRKTAIRTMAGLVEKGLVKKKIAANGIDCNAYKALPNFPDGSAKSTLGVVSNLPVGSVKITPGVVSNLPEGSVKMTPNNNIYNNTDIYTDKEDIGGAAAPASAPPKEKAEKSEPVKHRHGEYKNVLLTDEELDKLKELFPADLQERIERLSEYIASTGKKYKSHYATIRAWANRDGSATRRSPARGGYPGPVGPNGVALDPTKNDLDGLF